jgi:hypothetical protein
MMRRLVLDYAAQHKLAEADTGLVDIGWTGRMAGSFIELCEAAGMSRPAVLFWGHEPRTTGWTDPRVAAYMYNTATGEGLRWRVPNVPFIMETFCMADHGIVSGYRKDATGTIHPELMSPDNKAARDWGLGLYRSVLYAFAMALGPVRELPPRRAAPGCAPGPGRLLVPPDAPGSACMGQLSLRQRPRGNRGPLPRSAVHPRRPRPWGPRLARGIAGA